MNTPKKNALKTPALKNSTQNIPGIVNALALTPSGATIAQVECLLLSGRGKLILTGSLMGEARDAAQVALSLARVRARALGIDPADFLNTDVHFHIPAGPAKDGPSVGLAMFVALVSAMIRKSVPSDTAFTGEISLSGKIHGIGGLPKKTLAAFEVGTKRLFIPQDNASETNALPVIVKQGLSVSLVDHVETVLLLVFGNDFSKTKKR